MAQSSKPGPPAQAGRVALITGASRGLGYTVAEFLARQRWTLILSARHEVPLLEAVKRLQATGASISAVPGDVAHDQHRRDLVAAVRRVGRLDILFNNASELGASPFPPWWTSRSTSSDACSRSTSSRRSRSSTHAFRS